MEYCFEIFAILLNLNLNIFFLLTVVWLLSSCLMVLSEVREAGRTVRIVSCQDELQAGLIVMKVLEEIFTLSNEIKMSCDSQEFLSL